MVNPYLNTIDIMVNPAIRVLDIGCGSGFIVNMFARRYPHIKFDAIDFSNGIDYAKDFSKQHNINNITYYKEDLLKWDSKDNIYDLVICHGVLHHIPNYHLALKKISGLSNNNVIIGIYNYYGKLFKKIKSVKYVNKVLYADQELCPFELSFSDHRFRKLISNYNLIKVYPSYKNRLVDFYNLFNYSNGGLTLYLLKK